ncbi:MAG: A24 family peptidase [Candidatus Nanoarchaeia archaeon]
MELLLLSIGLAGVLFASVTDWKTREVPNWISYSMMAGGLGIRAIVSLTQSTYLPFLEGLLMFGICFLLGHLLYYSKQWGGGDSKLLMGIGAIFGNGLTLSFLPSNNLPFLAVFLANLFITGAFYGMIWAVVLGIIHREEVRSKLKKQHFPKQKIIWILLPLFILLFIFSFFLEAPFKFFGTSISIALISLLFTVYLLRYVKCIEDVVLKKLISVDKLTEGEWVLSTIKIGTKTICSKRDFCIKKNQIEELKKYKIKQVLIKEGIPFVPAFLFALLATLLTGRILIFFI